MSSISPRRPLIQSWRVATFVSDSVQPFRTASNRTAAWWSGSFTSTRSSPKIGTSRWPSAIPVRIASRPAALITSKMPGTATESASGRPRIDDGRNSAALATSFIHFADRTSSRISTAPACRKTSATSASRPRVDSSYGPTANQVPAGGV